MQRILTYLVAFQLLCCSCSKEDEIKKDPSTSTVVYDGLYVSGKIDTSYYYYLRFYDDKTVIGVTAIGEPLEVATWFVKNFTGNSVGSFKIVQDSLFFTLKSSEGNIDYKGLINSKDSTLNLNTYSHINNYKDERMYRFYQLH